MSGSNPLSSSPQKWTYYYETPVSNHNWRDIQIPMTTSPPKSEPRISLYAMLVIFLIVGTICLAVWLYFRHARPIGSGSAGSLVSQKTFDSRWTARPVVLLGLGDSATQGKGATPAHGYFQRLIINPPDEFSDMRGICLTQVIPQLQTVNLAAADSTSIDCVELQLPQLKAYPADTFGIVVITVGVNDILQDCGRSPPQDGAMYGATLNDINRFVGGFDQRLETIYQRVHDTFPGGYQIYLANIPDPADGDEAIQLPGLPIWTDWQYLLTSYNRILSLFVEHHRYITLVDLQTTFHGHGIHCTHFWLESYQKQDPHFWYTPDLSSHNERGHDAIRRQFLTEMTKELPSLLKLRLTTPLPRKNDRRFSPPEATITPVPDK